jgi:PAS domain-containing protein
MPTELPPELADRRTSDEALVIVDTTGTIVALSKPAEALFGVSEDDVRGEAVEIFMPQEFRFGHQAYRRGYLSEPADREMDPGLEPQGMNAVSEEAFDIHVRLEPFGQAGDLFVIAHVTKL